MRPIVAALLLLCSANALPRAAPLLPPEYGDGHRTAKLGVYSESTLAS
jgi:hypothetical protein